MHLYKTFSFPKKQTPSVSNFCRAFTTIFLDIHSFNREDSAPIYSLSPLLMGLPICVSTSRISSLSLPGRPVPISRIDEPILDQRDADTRILQVSTFRSHFSQLHNTPRHGRNGSTYSSKPTVTPVQRPSRPRSMPKPSQNEMGSATR